MKNENQAPMWSNFEDWELVAQSGNFLVKRFDDEELSYYAVKAAAGHWAQVYRNDHPMYHIIESFVNTDDEHIGDVLDVLVTLSYTISSVAPDPQFVEEVYKSVESLHARIEAYANDGKSEEEILREDEEADELQEKFEENVDI